MKLQIRREPNQFDHSMVMYNVYDAAKFQEGTAKGYQMGFHSLEGALAYIESMRTPAPSELVAEIEI